MGDPGKDRETLIERVVSAFRARDPHGAVRTSPAWHDLDESGRVEAFDLAEKMRMMEAAIDGEGLSTTARAVLRRISSSSS